MKHWRDYKTRSPIDKRFSREEEMMLKWMREDAAKLRADMAQILDTSRDAERHRRADEITYGKFSIEMEKYK